MMVDIKTIVSNMNEKALGGAKIPHSVSNPVLRVEEGTLYIAAFVYTYNRENLQKNKMPRPIHWIAADIETGNIVQEFDCREKDFSHAGFDTLYDLNDPNVVRPSREDFAEIYQLFDSVRSSYLREGRCDAGMYQRYLDRIFEITPDSYRKFYQELSDL